MTNETKIYRVVYYLEDTGFSEIYASTLGEANKIRKKLKANFSDDDQMFEVYSTETIRYKTNRRGIADLCNQITPT